ncbi:DUF6259 domain-containing protein [Bacteroidota bacterium]
MKCKKETWIIYLSLVLVTSLLSNCKKDSDHNIYIDNNRIRLGFDKTSGILTAFSDIVNPHEYLDENVINKPPWEVEFLNAQKSEIIRVTAANDFSYSKPDSQTLILTWHDFPELNNNELQLTVIIKLDEKKPLSSWKISLDGLNGELVNKVVFPKIGGIIDLGEEYLAVPFWMGQQMQNPRKHLASIQKREKKYEWHYPGQLSLQCLYLYSPEKCGFYAACSDTMAYRKNFSFTLDSLNNLSYKIYNYPELDSTITSYSPPYEGIIGSFKGDWITAAEKYRNWATQQTWCSESRFKNNLNPSWLDSTALWIWNRGRSNQVLHPAIDLKQRLGLPVSVFWHWWHGCSYDVGFPEYFPPREGRNSFISEVKTAEKYGIHSIVYMNVLQWGTSTKSWGEENASLFAVKDINGNLRSHVYNIFTGKSLTNMCIATNFWKNKYNTLADSALNPYHLNGIYMDQACLSRMCYDKTHGHSIGGGNYWVNHFGQLTRKIRSKSNFNNQPVLAGEGGGEVWLPYLNAFLTLQVSRERYAGPGSWETIPFFQAVYHQYGISYGNYSSLLTPPYDELWPEEYAPEEPQKLLDEKFNRQFLMEQARSFVWGMQPTIANYQPYLAKERKDEIDYLIKLARVRYKGLKYLLYGKFLRSPEIDIPVKEMDISKLSIYAGRGQDNVTSYKAKYPMVYSGTWKADDGDIGIALASISDNPVPINFNLHANDYALFSSGDVYMINVEGEKLLTSYQDGEINMDFILPPKGLCVVEITQNK